MPFLKDEMKKKDEAILEDMKQEIDEDATDDTAPHLELTHREKVQTEFAGRQVTQEKTNPTGDDIYHQHPKAPILPKMIQSANQCRHNPTKN